MRLTASPSINGSYVAAHSVWASLSATLAVIGGLLLIFALDQATGTGPVQHLYYLPIIFAAVTFGFGGGVAASLAAIVLYHLASPRLLALGYEHWDVLQVALFLAVGVITAKLTDDSRRFHVLATTDDLTGLHNLRSFEERLASMVRSCREARNPLALLVIDVDNLKSLNDAYGHLAGAEAVRTVGHIIAAVTTPETVACRYGGDEFVVAVSRCTEAEARHLADQIRHAVHTTAPVLADMPFPRRTLSVSVGVACCAFDSGTRSGGDIQLGEELFRSADAALYQAKAHGRNHVHAASG
jgi:diguanylate cyclase (GGDEF)-like protein